MNLFVRLLLDMRTDFLCFCESVMISSSVFLRHSGIVARIEGVVLGSNKVGFLLSIVVRNSHH